jgi:diacylglycerol kinase (ATP)
MSAISLDGHGTLAPLALNSARIATPTPIRKPKENRQMTDQQPLPATAAVAAAAESRPPIVILNPACRYGRRIRPIIEGALKGRAGELALTEAAGAAEKLAADAATNGRSIVVVGGDGTVAEVANGILTSGARVPLGIVPAGNGNDYALRTLHLPKDPQSALEIALQGRAIPMDAGQVNGRYFVNDMGVGIDANVAAAAERMKRIPFLRGQPLYYTASLRELLFHYNEIPELTVVCDSEASERRLYALVAASIGPTYGGGFRINPRADPHDGLFDVCAIWKPSRLRALRLLTMIQHGTHLNEPEVKLLRAHEVVLEAQRPIHGHLDGEVITAQRFEAHILPGALLVRQPWVPPRHPMHPSA